MKKILLNRDDFRNAVFNRDHNCCVVCKSPAQDAHHLIDRSLWSDGGYYIDNGVSLCSEHHKLAESTMISANELRLLAGIESALYPDILSLTEFVVDYDKWGNPILKNNKRLKGELFEKSASLFSPEILLSFDKDYDMIVDKYPRTYHLPFSPGTTSDDRIASSIGNILTGERIMTEKLDGENTCISEFGLYARSRTAPTQNPWAQWLKSKWDAIKKDLKDFGIEICGENLYGEHSIIYSGLQQHFYVFGIRDTEHDIWLSWDETEYYAELFDFPTVPVVMRFAPYTNTTVEDLKNVIDSLMSRSSELSDDKLFKSPKEGIVTRVSREFNCDMFYNSVFKYVRKKHVKTNQHWAKNWKRAYLNYELQNMRERLPEIYKTQIEQGLLTI
jgi:hypothetical protein